MSEYAGLKPQNLASAEIDGWRGRCNDIYARAERSVGQSLEVAKNRGKTAKLPHLGGQRLAQMTAIAETCDATARQTAALRAALAEWHNVELRRPFFAHGIATPLQDNHSSWYVMFDFTAYRSNQPAPERWTLSKSEADDFENRLSLAFAGLSRELGQLKKRLSA